MIITLDFRALQRAIRRIKNNNCFALMMTITMFRLDDCVLFVKIMTAAIFYKTGNKGNPCLSPTFKVSAVFILKAFRTIAYFFQWQK